MPSVIPTVMSNYTSIHLIEYTVGGSEPISTRVSKHLHELVLGVLAALPVSTLFR